MAERLDRLNRRLIALLRIVGVSALLVSAISPADDFVQQEFIHSHAQHATVNARSRAGRNSQHSIAPAQVAPSIRLRPSRTRIDRDLPDFSPTSAQAGKAAANSYRAPPR